MCYVKYNIHGTEKQSRGQGCPWYVDATQHSSPFPLHLHRCYPRGREMLRSHPDSRFPSPASLEVLVRAREQAPARAELPAFASDFPFALAVPSARGQRTSALLFPLRRPPRVCAF